MSAMGSLYEKVGEVGVLDQGDHAAGRGWRASMIFAGSFSEV